MNSHNVYDDLHQENVHFSKLKSFFSINCIRLSTVLPLKVVECNDSIIIILYLLGCHTKLISNSTYETDNECIY